MLFVPLSLTASLLAQTVSGPTLAVDLETSPVPGGLSSDPEVVGENAYGTFFTADLDGTVRSLWFTDGTTAGTVPVPHIGPHYPFSGSSHSATLPDERLVFTVGFEDGLFVADAQGAGLDWLGSEFDEDFRPLWLTAWGSEVWFFAATPEAGRELWRTDGTVAGTVPGPEVVPGAGSLFTLGEQSIVVGGKLFFTSSEPVPAVWCLASPSSAPLKLIEFETTWATMVPRLSKIGDLCVFSGYVSGLGAEPYVSDGTVAGTKLLADIRPGSVGSSSVFLCESAGKLFFEANDGTHGKELWTTDGTTAQTQMVLDLAPGVASSAGWQIGVPFGSGIVYHARWPVEGVELTFSDGTSAGTYLITDLEPGPFGSQPQDGEELRTVGGRVVFNAHTDATGTELWATDGTEAGTTLLHDFVPGPGSNAVRFLGMTPAGLVVKGDDDGLLGCEPWITDGTASATSLLADLSVAPSSSGAMPTRLAAAREHVFFGADVVGMGNEAWLSDGTPAGTSSLGDYLPGPEGITTASIGTLGNRLLFYRTGFVTGVTLSATDGTPAGTVEIGHQIPNIGYSFYLRWTDPMGGRILISMYGLFGPFGGGPPAVWTSDGTAAGTVPLPSPPWPATGSGEIFKDVLDDAFLMRADMDGGLGEELYRNDGTLGGTELVLDIEPGPGSSSPEGRVRLGHGVVFEATTSAHGTELWFTDGTATGTVRLTDVKPGPDSTYFGSGSSGVAVVGDHLYFIAYDDSGFGTLWRTDGTPAGTGQPLAPWEAPGGNRPTWLAAVGDTLYFESYDGAGGRSLWSTDGTDAGTVQVFVGQTEARGTVGDGGLFAFLAHAGPYGQELYTTDGTAAGVQVLVDIAPGPKSSWPDRLTRVGRQMFLAADDGDAGCELHVFDLVAAGGQVSEPFGVGCGAALDASGDASPGGTLTIELKGAPLAPATVYWSPTKSWVDLGLGCSLYAAVPSVLVSVSTDAAGQAQIPVTFTGTPAVIGAEFALQGIVVGGPLLGGFGLTNGVEVIVGS